MILTFSLVRFSKTLSKKICISRLYIFGSFCSSFFRACLKSLDTDRSSVFISKSSSCQSVVQMKIYGWVWPLSHNVVFLPPILPPVLVVALLVIRLCRVYRDCLADDLYFWNSSVWSSFSRSMVRRFKIVWTEVAIGRYDGRTNTSLISDFLGNLFIPIKIMVEGKQTVWDDFFQIKLLLQPESILSRMIEILAL